MKFGLILGFVWLLLKLIASSATKRRRQQRVFFTGIVNCTSDRIVIVG